MSLPLQDPKELEGRDGEKNKFREFFWDSVLLYVVYSIIALAAMDALTEYIRSSNVVCRVDSDIQYINNYCSGSLPPTQFFPVFIVVHAILIAIPHYLWLNLYGEKFDFFFDLALQMKPIKMKGKYEETNFTIASQLDSAFNTFQQNWMFPAYFLKLVLQLGIAVGGFISVIVVFTDFNETFNCPHNFNASDKDPFWPMNNTVQCVFTTLRLLSLIRIADLVLLALVILGFSWALLWSIRPHSAELGSKDIAKFSFQTGLLPRFYVRDFTYFPRDKKLKNFMHKVYSFMPWAAWRGPRISSALDFMLLKLFRTNGGLGYTFRMTKVLQKLRYLNESDHRCLILHLQGKGETVANDLVWRFAKSPTSERVYESFKPVGGDGKHIVLPNTLRGTILGLAGFVQKNDSVLYICFGNVPSKGIPFALGRVFKKVNIINFNPDYWSDEKPVEIIHHPTTTVTTVTCHENIMLVESFQIVREIHTIWAVRNIYGEGYCPSDMIVVQPLCSEAHKTTVKLFLEAIDDHISQCAVLVLLCPTNISGKNVVEEKDVFRYEPSPSRFVPYEVNVALDKGLNEATKKEAFLWPPKEYGDGRAKSKEREEGTEDENLPFLVIEGREREIVDACLVCHRCKRSCQCRKKLECQRSHTFSQFTDCGGAFCVFEISIFKRKCQHLQL